MSTKVRRRPDSAREARPGRPPEANHIASRAAAEAYLSARRGPRFVRFFRMQLVHPESSASESPHTAAWRDAHAVLDAVARVRAAVPGLFSDAGDMFPGLDEQLEKLEAILAMNLHPPAFPPDVAGAAARLGRAQDQLRFAVRVLATCRRLFSPPLELPTARELMCLAVVCGAERPIADVVRAAKRLASWDKFRARALHEYEPLTRPFLEP